MSLLYDFNEAFLLNEENRRPDLFTILLDVFDSVDDMLLFTSLVYFN